MAFDANRHFDNCSSLEDVVQIVNDEFGTELTAEQLAAQYARDAVNEAGYEINEKNIEAHLDVLFENEAKFDYEEALKIALKK